MIPSDHFVRYYNEVFKALEALGHEHLVAYWRELGRLQTAELGESFKQGGLQAAYVYWKRIQDEENCVGQLRLTDDYVEFVMERCPSLSKVLDNDAGACPWYCDHCMGWVEPVMEYAGLHAVMDMRGRDVPECCFRVYRDVDKALAFRRTARVPADPYGKARAGETSQGAVEPGEQGR